MVRGTLRFSPPDRAALQRLVFDPTSEPSFELLKACLVWPDERPERISSAGYELLGDLWIVRGFLHRQVPTEAWALDPAHFQEVWRDALEDVPGWPGFRRLQLSEVERAYLDQSLREASSSDDY